MFSSALAASTRPPRLGIFVRDQITKLLAAPQLAKLALVRSLLDRIQLPDYAWGR